MSRARLAQCRAFLLDMDGTLYLDERLLPGARELVALLDQRGLPYLFVTNNSSRRGEDYRQRLERLDIHVPVDRILTSGDATIDYLLHHTPHRSAYVVGTPGLEHDFRAAGFSLDPIDPDCVVVGYDTTVTYEKLEIACRHLFSGKPYVATHPDRTCITQRGLIPDIAAIIAACEAVTGRAPDRILGKPYPEMVEVALRRLGTSAATTAIVGDQLDTDMTMAELSGLVAVLVMSGETTQAKLDEWPVDRRPAIIASHIGEVLDWLT
ncbi:MAG TPA: HAD-IIA family hydrolase [Kofleriaceae bacterium]|nr:HAD-IIA family hydrolase [Kofleriaceae bacterium]